jgi:hypothetical protein
MLTTFRRRPSNVSSRRLSAFRRVFSRSSSSTLLPKLLENRDRSLISLYSGEIQSGTAAFSKRRKNRIAGCWKTRTPSTRRTGANRSASPRRGYSRTPTRRLPCQVPIAFEWPSTAHRPGLPPSFAPWPRPRLSIPPSLRSPHRARPSGFPSPSCR